MSCVLYVTNLPPDITLEALTIYFQSSTKSGGGDVDFDACELQDGGKAIVVFEQREYLDNVLKRGHEIGGYKLGVSEKQFKPVPKRRKNVPQTTAKEQEIPPEKEKAHLGEVRTVIVSGLYPGTTDEIVEMFFENQKRSGGGSIEKMERCEPGVAHITFDSPEVAAQVLKRGNCELDGYLLQLKEKQPELILPRDRKKLYVENIDPKTTHDSLTNYMEARTKLEVYKVEFGDHKNAIVTFDEEPDMKMVLENAKALEGAALEISNPPVCNSIRVTGFNTANTTKQAIEMYFEKENKGGGKIYGDVIYQKDQANAVVSFCDPEVVENLITGEHKLNDAVLCLHQHYQFMNTITETTTKTVELDAVVLDHIIRNCEEEVRGLFGSEMINTLMKMKEELTLPKDVAERIEGYVNQFKVREVPFCQKLLDSVKGEFQAKITKLTTNKNITVAIEEERLQVQLVGKENDLQVVYDKFKSEIAEMEQALSIATEKIDVPEPKLELLLLHGVEEVLKNEFHVDVKIEPAKKTITIRGIGKQVLLASKRASHICNHIKEDSIDLDETGKRFLESGMLGVINCDMKTSKLGGMISLDKSKKNRAKLFVLPVAAISDVQSYVINYMFQRNYKLDEESLALLKSNKWEEFCNDVEKNSSVMMNTGTRSVISLIGKKPDVEDTFKKLHNFMKRNTIVKETIDIGEGYALYLAKYRKNDLKGIETRLEEHFVRVRVVEEEGTMTIDGTKDGIKEARKYIDECITNIAKDKFSFDKPRMHNYLKSEEGKIFIEGIQSKHECLIRLTEDDERASTNISPFRRQPHPDKAASTLLCSYETPEKISFKVYNGDITKHRCDVIVNAANEDLKHIGGVAKSILDAGGKEIQNECEAHVKTSGKVFEGECFSGSPGRLPCNRLIHAVGPQWDDRNREKVCNILRVTCRKALEKAMSYQSIALPAISSGVYGFPKEICANIMIRSAEEFSKNHGNSALKEIHFVNNDERSGEAFAMQLRERYGGSSSFRSNQTSTSTRQSGSSKSQFYFQSKERSPPSDLPDQGLPRRKSDDFIVTKEGMKISVVVGDLSSYKADVLVNTTGQNLNLDSNPCGKALSNKAGPILQAECDKIGTLKLDELALTPGGNLPCDEVYHVLCVEWNSGHGEQVLRSIIKRCLKNCNSRGKQSIAFPAIGTGRLGFPHDEAAKIFFEEVKEFRKRVSNCRIKEVSFVVYNKDTKSVQSFKNELKKQAEWGSSKPGNDLGGSQKRWKRNPNPEYDSKGVMCIQVGEDREIEIVKSDITKETTQVIAHLTNPLLFMGSGVATALVKAGGSEIEGECKKQRRSNATLQVGTTVLTTAGRLNARYIAHMVAPNGPSPNEIENCIRSCLGTVSAKQCESVSFPAVGTGSLNHDPEKAATTVLTPIIRFLQTSSGSLKTVRIVLRDEEIVNAFEASAKRLLENERPGMFRKIMNFFWKSESTAVSVEEIHVPPAITKKLFLEIFGNNYATVRLAKQTILHVEESQNKKDKLEDDNIEKLSNQQISQIKRLCEINDVVVTIEKDLNRIVLVGHSEDVAKMMTEIVKILKTIGETEKEREKAALQADLADIVSQGVQWYYEDPATGDQEEYHKHTNAIIEKAYSRKEKSVIFMLDNERCEIVFSKMNETNLDKNKEMKVIRKDLKVEDVCVPEYWDPQPCDASGKERAVHLVPLNPNDPNDEYKNISAHFHQTAGEQILAIQRVQNPSLFKLYSLKKQSLDKKNGKKDNEKFLFHGTRGDKLDEINEHGLNRSYAGNTHGARFGKGVYFARDASMSVGYAHSDFSGQRHMYFTRVAVGDYTVGTQGMLVPPSKGGRSNDSYDSVVNNMRNPTIFVLFYDNQYYPEYLITFR